MQMASSSSSSTIDNVKYENLTCECGRKAVVLVSKSTRNPGRLYYGCSNHGWLKWVVAGKVEDNLSGNHISRRAQVAEYRVMRNNFSVDEVAGHNVGLNFNVLLWALIIINLVLLAAYLLGLLIQLMRG